MLYMYTVLLRQNHLFLLCIPVYIFIYKQINFSEQMHDIVRITNRFGTALEIAQL